MSDAADRISTPTESSKADPPPDDLFASTDRFLQRHLGSNSAEINRMLETLGHGSLDALIGAAVPGAIRLRRPLDLPSPQGEGATLRELREIGKTNIVYRSYIGMGYQECITPPVIQRNILENPGWYTAYTPYQAEIAQGRLEALLNFQTMVIDLTGLDIANASLLDEATAAAEAVTMAFAVRKDKACRAVFVSERCHPQTIDVVRTRAVPLGIEIVTGIDFDFSTPIFAALLQYPATDGVIHDPSAFFERVHAQGGLAIVAADILALVTLKPPGELGADIAVGSTQRFGIPLGYGGPHAAYMATRDEFKRHLPGRIVGVSRDSEGRTAFRLALQTREQHIRRERATSNICTAQVLLAVIASTYAVYHGPQGLRAIAGRIHRIAKRLAAHLSALGFEVASPFFDTLKVHTGARPAREILARAAERHINLRLLDDQHVGIAVDESTDNLDPLIEIFGGSPGAPPADQSGFNLPPAFVRQSDFLTHPVFNTHHTETEMLRYLHRLESRDLSLTTSMIPLGSCTMKLNATAEMLPVTWFGIARMHPFAPVDQAQGYQTLFHQLSKWLAEITGFSAVSLQPNAGSQGEFAGLLAIREYHRSRGDTKRDVCLIPTSAHGTNPASAVMAGLRVVPVKCLVNGDIDLDDLRAKAEKHAAELAALMITYPSTHGVFEETIVEVCEIIHTHGGQVYMDGANMNAQVGLCRPGDFGADVCHLNLHKTFCIPHGGGGPGVGPIAVADHLRPFLPDHPVVHVGEGIGAIAAAPWGSASILVIPWVYIRMMGASGLTEATRVAILNANYIARRLDPCFPVLFKGRNGLVAHECILDLRPFKAKTGIDVEDVAKRLMDFGFHAPTVSWPVPGTMMVEPTESESLEELDRFCDAMITIHSEIEEIATGRADAADNPLKNAPHTAQSVTADNWSHPYSREKAAYPAPWLRQHKFWPSVGRIDNVFGDRNPVCACPPVESYLEQ